MLFVTTLDVIPGKTDELLDSIKEMQIPEDIKLRECLALFGKPDYIMVYEAPNEDRAMNFILKFVAYAIPRTSLSVPVERK